MERDVVIGCKTVVINISTHTLTWSVTGLNVIDLLMKNISTHTLTWSVT